ncbi:MAG TPA: hypothetical protein PKV48_03760, partial [Thermodesulfobacteriota bacterium]|nr:hypothetical protein [Thermodesulfobacteriota bacterium]
MKIATLHCISGEEHTLRIDAYVPISGLPWRTPEVLEIESLSDQVKAILPKTTYLHGESGGKELAY